MKNQTKNIAAAIIISALFFVPIFCNAQRVIYYTTNDQTLNELRNDLIHIKGEIYSLKQELETVNEQMRALKEQISNLQDIDPYVLPCVVNVGEGSKLVMDAKELSVEIERCREVFEYWEGQQTRLIKLIENLTNKYIYTKKRIEEILKNQQLLSVKFKIN